MTTLATSTRTSKATQLPQKAPKEAAPKPAETTSDRVRSRAYAIYQARSGNGTAGDAVSDWLQAERELNAEPNVFSNDVELKCRARGERLLASGK